WVVPFWSSALSVAAGSLTRRRVAEPPVFAEQHARGTMARAPVAQAFTHSGADMLRVTCMALMNVIPVVTTIFGAAYAVQPGYGIEMREDVYLWIPVLGNCLAVVVIPFGGPLSESRGGRAA